MYKHELKVTIKNDFLDVDMICHMRDSSGQCQHKHASYAHDYIRQSDTDWKENDGCPFAEIFVGQSDIGWFCSEKDNKVNRSVFYEAKLVEGPDGRFSPSSEGNVILELAGKNEYVQLVLDGVVVRDVPLASSPEHEYVWEVEWEEDADLDDAPMWFRTGKYTVK